ncbi:MAG: glycogen/starch/alpha-glucan phosphorylase, partial [Cetobacterium sp.]
HDEFKDILNHIFGEGDPYFVLKDFSAYIHAQEKINVLYENRRGWLQMSLINIAHSGKFSSDNSIKKYAEDIWHIKRVKIDE